MIEEAQHEGGIDVVELHRAGCLVQPLFSKGEKQGVFPARLPDFVRAA
jgi:hypothetical protein